MNEPRDAIVGEALRALDIPDHAPDFWDRLESSLAESPTGVDDPGTDRDAGSDVIGLADPAGARGASGRRRMPVLGLVAAAAVVVALVVGAAVLRGGGDDESQLDTADPTETSEPDVVPPPPEEDVTTETTAPPETTTTVLSGEELAAEAEQTAIAWIDALAAGDMAGAYELFDLQTREEIDSAEFEQLSSGLAEGAAAFGGDGMQRDVTVLQTSGGVLHVVTFTGDVEREGMIETATYPVVVTGGGVHFTLEGPQLELDPEYARSSGTTLASPLELVVGDVDEAWLWVDGGEPQALAERGQVSIDVEQIAGPGTRQVSLVAVQGGAVTARSYTVVVP